MIKLLAKLGRFNSVARRSDLVGRLGGEEFAIVLTEFDTACKDSIDDLLARADLALYQAKNSGRNQTAIFNPHLNQAAAG